jgi:hypothetical protein
LAAAAETVIKVVIEMIEVVTEMIEVAIENRRVEGFS